LDNGDPKKEARTLPEPAGAVASARIIRRPADLIRAKMAVSLSALLCLFPSRALASANTLAVGDKATASAPIDVAINPLGDLNFRTKAEIFNWRAQILSKSPELLLSAYTPTPEIFERIEDGRPWWGVKGAFVWGAGQRSIEGLSEESRFVLNPLLLVGANPNTALMWDGKTISDKDLADNAFPYVWLPQTLRWYPPQALVEVVYDITAFNKELEARKAKLKTSPDTVNRFGLIAYNARDFGYNYIFLHLDKSINVTADEPNKEPVQIVQMIHCGGSCQYPGGCNNMSPAMPKIDYFRFSALPARAHITLWRDRPKTVEDKPDLTYFLDLR
jgi:hypothetical protein